MKNKKPIEDWDKFREQFVRWTLRRSSFRWPARSMALKLARTRQKTNPTTGRLCWHVKCAICLIEILEKEGELDHVRPVIPTSNVPSVWDKANYIGWSCETYLGQIVRNMLPEPAGFQVLCHSCHSIKTRGENEQRRISRKRKSGAKG